MNGVEKGVELGVEGNAPKSRPFRPRNGENPLLLVLVVWLTFRLLPPGGWGTRWGAGGVEGYGGRCCADGLGFGRDDEVRALTSSCSVVVVVSDVDVVVSDVVVVVVEA